MNTKELEQRYAKAISAHQSGRLSEAEAIYGQILKVMPQADAVLTNMAALQYNKGNFEQALRYVDRALKVNPVNIDALVNRASTLLAMDNDAEAVAAYNEVIRLNEANPTAHYNLANLRYRQGDLAAAEAGFRRAAALKHDFYQAYFNLGNVLTDLKRPVEACSAFEKALMAKPDHSGAHHNLASLLADLGDWDAAMRQIDLGLEMDGQSALLWCLKGKLLSDVGLMHDALEATEKAIAIDATSADFWIQQGNIHRDMLCLRDAKNDFEHALTLVPGHEGALRNLHNLQAEEVPRWHFSMLADEARNRAYHTVLRKLVRPGDRVLDIGTGSGLLAMMAARAGAGEVIACEREPGIAAVARTIIEKNGYSDIVKVHTLDSRLLRLGKEVSERVDLIVSEILDVAVTGEGMLPSIRAALRNLAKPDTKVIPSSATVKVQLLELPYSHYNPGLDNVEGFDLREFEQFRQEGGRKTFYLQADHGQECSEVVDLRTFDFLKPGIALSETRPERFSIRFEHVAMKNIDGLLLWFDLALDPETVMSSGPGGEFEHWGQVFYPLHPLPQPGLPVTVHCEMHDFGWRFWNEASNE
jgi:tetratricopeptide (TPR) repeat protein